MSGIFLIVWDETLRNQSPILKPTRGGWPHITLAYTGSNLGKTALCSTAASITLATLTLGMTITITEAYVNSFENEPGHIRHDVLLRIAENEYIEELRQTFIREKYENHKDFSMHDPHVTHAIYESQQSAKTQADYLNQIFLPYKVTLTGITID